MTLRERVAREAASLGIHSAAVGLLHQGVPERDVQEALCLSGKHHQAMQLRPKDEYPYVRHIRAALLEEQRLRG